MTPPLSFSPQQGTTMPQAVKISDAEMEAVREAASLNSRSISGQAEHWIRLGRAVERDPRFGYVQIEEALKALRSIDTLTEQQQEAYLDRLEDEMAKETPAERAFWEDRQSKGLGVGMDEDGKPVGR